MGPKHYPVLLGVKSSVGVLLSFVSNTAAQPWKGAKNWLDRVCFRETGTQGGVVKCVDTLGNTSGEGEFLKAD